MTGILNVALMGIFVWSGVDVGIQEPISQIPARANANIELTLVRLTGYNAVPEQTDGTPNVTASGTFSNPEVVAARSRDLAEAMPYGTIIALEAPGEKEFSCGFKTVGHLIGYRVIADSMHERKRRQIDVLYDIKNLVQVGTKEMNPAVAAGICNVTVRVIGKIPVKEIPATQEDLAKFVNRKIAMR
ncbi:MAG: hypothetical protein AAB355_00890 [Patescibacteria group bacterium]